MLSRKHSSCSAVNPVGEFLAPLWEGPTPDVYPDFGGRHNKRDKPWDTVLHWVKEQVERGSKLPQLLLANKRSDPMLLLGVLGCPLAPFSVSNASLPPCCMSTKDAPIESSCAQYIIQQYLAATGGNKLLSSIKNSYTRGKVRMLTTEFETATRIRKNPIKAAENGWFVLWQLMPDKWHVELEIEGNSVQAGSDGKVVWRSTSWLGAHAAKGPVRPLRRAVQGLDPITTANLFINARCIGEKKIGDEDCFVLKLSADPAVLKSRSDGPAEIIWHVLYGYFSQRTGLLVFVEDSHLTRIQGNGVEVVYWETTIESSVQDYRPVDGVNIAHSGHSVVTLFRFGEEAMSHTKTRMEEMWSIEEVAFNVEGLSLDYFLPPCDVGKGTSKKS
ncbi:hypothetical protein KP509_22G055700 [Ceratopteris richardii]|uniref:Uncharacterized protein n=1 Tax=Ceratopteris richardii TaxID=49495 RepID=A0A8T2S6G1_CERRI|nr:hypothetical protein KP509_22G055700 [Ceratopteris richardii]KAH7307369.1 hypothetical protein KP509_22G055700 [Ceratopteris richardii]